MVCSKCSGQKVQLPTDNGGRPQRVCKTCLEIFNGLTPSLIMDGVASGTPNSSSNTSASTPTSPPGGASGDRTSLVVLRRGVLEVKASDAGVLSGFLHLRTRGKTWMERWFLLKKDFVLYSFATREVSFKFHDVSFNDSLSEKSWNEHFPRLPCYKLEVEYSVALIFD